jgi:antitoxin VapB
MEYNAKSFQSGNSVAIRMPAALRVEPGADWIVREQGDDLILSRKPAPRQRIDVSGFAGKAPGIRLAPREDFDERPSVIAARKAAAAE